MRKLIVFILLNIFVYSVSAQELRIIELRPDKVTQLIFSSEIIRAKGGFVNKQDIISIHEGRILDMQAMGPFAETNMNVITADGCYYSFDVHFNPKASVVNHIISIEESIYKENKDERKTVNPLTGDPVTIKHDEISEKTPVPAYEKIMSSDGYIKANNIAKMQKFSLMIKGVYADENSLYIRLQIDNDSNVKFEVDYIAFYTTAKITKKTSTQERVQLMPTYIHNEIKQIEAKSNQEVIYRFDRFTISRDKILLAEVIEKNGDRNIGLKIKENIIIDAQKL